MKPLLRLFVPFLSVLALLTACHPTAKEPTLQTEALGRGVVAIRQDAETVVVSWRFLSSDPDDVAFNVYRGEELIAQVPDTAATFLIDTYSSTEAACYTVKPVIDGVEQAEAGSYTLPQDAPVGYINIPLDVPADGQTPAGDLYTYSPNDASIGDVDGDGNYEIILKWDPSNAHDNAHDGYTGNVLIDCYRLTGEKLWRIDLGRNIRAGAHYTQFMVYDLDGDGCAEVVMKTSDGTIDGLGHVIGDPEADYREPGDSTSMESNDDFERRRMPDQQGRRGDPRQGDGQQPGQGGPGQGGGRQPGQGGPGQGGGPQGGQPTPPQGGMPQGGQPGQGGGPQGGAPQGGPQGMPQGGQPQGMPQGMGPGGPQGNGPQGVARTRDAMPRRNAPKNQGRILTGNEYLTVFSGLTGEALQTIDYVPERGNLEDWGDNYANRSDRYLACVAFLDGLHPSVVMCRGYYTRAVLAAFDWDGSQLTQRWVFDSNNPGCEAYAGQGNHSLRVADVDGDGCDEIVYGSCTIDHDGTGLYSTGMGHGDAMHLTQFSPDLPGLQVWACHENRQDGSSFRSAATGEVYFQVKDGTDVGRCMAADIDAGNPGVEMWSLKSGGILNIKGEKVDELVPGLSYNMAVWWDGDLLRELLDKNVVSKYDAEAHACLPVVVFEGCQSNNGSKATPCIQGDLIGDWREEVLLRTADNTALHLYVSPIPTDYRVRTFLEDRPYRLSLVTQNVAYNQPTQLGFYFGPDMEGK